MSLIGVLSNLFVSRFQETKNNSELKNYVCISPETIVGHFIEDTDCEKVIYHATGTMLKNKKKVNLEYIEDYLNLILSDLKIITGFDTELNTNSQSLRAVGFIKQGIGECISISDKEDISNWIKDAFIYKNRPYNYASVIINKKYDDDEYNTYIKTFEDKILIDIRLDEKHLQFLVDQVYKNTLCEVSVLCDFYRDNNRNKYYIDGLTTRKNQDFNFTFDPSKPALTYNILQIDNFLANYFYS